MKKLAEVPSKMPRSGIREVMDLAWKKEKEGKVIHLEVGQPDFETPSHILEATCKYVREGKTKYIPNAGVPELREAVAKRFESRTGVPTTPENILITTGAVLSVMSAFMTILESGDEVRSSGSSMAELPDGGCFGAWHFTFLHPESQDRVPP